MPQMTAQAAPAPRPVSAEMLAAGLAALQPFSASASSGSLVIPALKLVDVLPAVYRAMAAARPFTRDPTAAARQRRRRAKVLRLIHHVKRGNSKRKGA